MEFDLIQKYFIRPASHPSIVLGNGDDCALLHSDQTLAFSTDTLVEGTHFLKDKITPADLGYRALAVNISDLSAMGAKPLAFLLSITLPELNEAWLTEFSNGLFSWDLDLIGGNTTCGPLAITIHIIGELPKGKSLNRSNAKLDDDIYVTGTLGLAPVRPISRIQFAQGLLDLAHAAIDISDGLTQDLAHILNASKLGGVLNIKSIPGRDFHLGEDYELCFTAPSKNRELIAAWAKKTKTPLALVGQIVAEPGLREAINNTPIPTRGYQHFT